MKKVTLKKMGISGYSYVCPVKGLLVASKIKNGTIKCKCGETHAAEIAKKGGM